MSETRYNVYWGTRKVASAVEPDVAVRITEGFFTRYYQEALSGVMITIEIVREDEEEDAQ
jgi:hypothetical protein